MEIYGRILDFFCSPKKRKIFILVLLTLTFVIIIMHSCTSSVPYDSPKIMICEKCGYRQQLRQAEKIKCPKCGKEMGCLWKCMTCRYEFEYNPQKERASYRTEEEFRKAKIKSCRCPNCDSLETFPVTARNMPEKIPAPAK